MDAAKHLAKANELHSSLQRLRPTDGAHQYAAAHLLARFGEHHDKHHRVAAALRRHGLGEVAEAFQRLQTLRAGRWYGGQGDGEVVRECL